MIPEVLEFWNNTRMVQAFLCYGLLFDWDDGQDLVMETLKEAVTR